VSIGIGGLKPFPASYVALNKYGDCKALTNYMKALLSYAGIESFYTLIYASRQPRKPAKCFASEFNHALLAVPLGNDTIWLENTSNINPFGYVGTSIQNRDALIVSNENSRLVRVPELKKEDVLVLNRLSYDLNVNGDARLAVNSSFKGRNFEKFNQLHTDYVNDDKERIIRDYMPFGNYEVVTWELKKQNRDTARIDLNVVLNVSKVLKSLGNEFYFEVRKCDIPSFEPPAVRSLPVAIPYPIYSIDTLEYDLPAGYGIKTPPDTVEIDTRFGNYRRVLLDAGKKIIVLRKFEVYTGNYITVEYPDFYNFIRSVREADVKKIVIRPAL